MKSAVVLVAALLAGTAPAFAQNSVGDAVLALWSGAGDAAVQTVNGQIYGGTIEATVLNIDGNGTTLGANDLVPAFRISRNGTALVFPGRRPLARRVQPVGGRQRRRDSGAALPASISESVTGRDAAQTYSQQFLLTTALAITSARRAGGTSRARNRRAARVRAVRRAGPDRPRVAGALPTRRASTPPFKAASRSRTRTWAGCARPARVRTRLRRDYHPSIEIDAPLLVRFGARRPLRACSTRTATRSTSARFDLGGGVWSSVQKDFDKVRLVGAGLLQGSKSLVPSGLVGDEMRLLADAVNDRGVAWDLGYGMVGGYALTTRTSLNGKFLQTVPIGTPAAEDRPAPWLVIGACRISSAATRPWTSATSCRRLAASSAHSVFVQGYFGW